MRSIAIIIVFALAIWVGFGGPVPVVVTKPLQPSDEIPTFEQAMANHDAFQKAHRSGRVREDPDRKQLRRDVLRAAERLDRSPCNTAAQGQLIEATTAFLRKMAKEPWGKKSEPSVEVIKVDDREIDVTQYLNEEALEAISKAAGRGEIRPEDLPSDLGVLRDMLVAGPPIGRTVCDG